MALLIIMGYHFGVGWLQGGFFSLDIFYVLSGYLITGLLVSEYRKRGRIKLSAFWLRRARRLLPALVIVLVVVSLLVRFVAAPGLYPDFRMSALSAFFYFSNWWQIAASSNYFVVTGPASPLTHTWSLAVEEQFYLIWPLVVLAVMHLSRNFIRGIRVLLVLSVVGALASAMEMALLYHPAANTTRLYFGTDTHAQSILVGSVLACSMTIIQMRRGSEGMAPTAGSPGPSGSGSPRPRRVGRDPLAHLHLGGHLAVRLSGRVPALGPVGGGHHHRRGVRPPRPDRPRAVPVPAGVDRHHLLWRLSVALPGLRVRRLGADRPVRSVSVGGPLRRCTFALATASYYLVERPVIYGTFWRSLRAIGPGRRGGW